MGAKPSRQLLWWSRFTSHVVANFRDTELYMTNHPDLASVLRRLQLGGDALIESGVADVNQWIEALYTPQSGIDDICEEFFLSGDQDGQCLVLMGSAGDGKTALQNRYDRLSRQEGKALVDIHRDATEAYSSKGSHIDTLHEVVSHIERNRVHGGPRTSVAINTGPSIDFFERHQYGKEFHVIWEALTAGRDQLVTRHDGVTVINLNRRQTFGTTPNGLGTGLLLSLLEKFSASEESSPFHELYVQACKEGDEDACILLHNARVLSDQETRQRIATWVAAAAIAETTPLNPRILIHTVSRLLLTQPLAQLTNRPRAGSLTADCLPPGHRANALIWNQVFDPPFKRDGSSRIYLDPVSQVSIDLDQEILDLTRKQPEWFTTLTQDHEHPIQAAATELRRRYLRGESEHDDPIKQDDLTQFLWALQYFKGTDGKDADQGASTVSETVQAAQASWTGRSGQDGWIELTEGHRNKTVTLLAPKTEVHHDIDGAREHTIKESRIGFLWMILRAEGGEAVDLPLTFAAYKLMSRIQRGYRPSGHDYTRSAALARLASRFGAFTKKRDKVQMFFPTEGHRLTIRRNEFGTIHMEVSDD